jgi:integrase
MKPAGLKGDRNMAQLYQRGTLRKLTRSNGEEAWEWRFSQDRKRKQETFQVADYPTERVMWQHLETRISLLNSSAVPQRRGVVTLGWVIERYRTEHLATLAKSTRDTDGSMLSLHIEPKWAEVAVTDIQAMEVDEWIKTLTTLRPSSKGRARRLMKQLLDKAMFWRLMPTVINPMTQVHIKGVTKRAKKIVPYTPEQVWTLYNGLVEPYSVMVATVACLGLRAEELVALQWPDFDFEGRKIVTISRAYTHGALGEPKSDASGAELPLPKELIAILQAYRTRCVNSVWLFPSSVTGGPRSADMILADHLKPAAARLGLPMPGWHRSFRHGLKTWLGSGKGTLTQQKDMMRHAAMPVDDMYGATPVEEMRPLFAAVAKKLLPRRTPQAIQ